jgi:adenylate kinase family enzyme
VYQNETLPILDYFKKEGKVVTVTGEDDPNGSYENLLTALKTSNIKGMKEFIEG